MRPYARASLLGSDAELRRMLSADGARAGRFVGRVGPVQRGSHAGRCYAVKVSAWGVPVVPTLNDATCGFPYRNEFEHKKLNKKLDAASVIALMKEHVNDERMAKMERVIEHRTFK